MKQGLGKDSMGGLAMAREAALMRGRVVLLRAVARADGYDQELVEIVRAVDVAFAVSLPSGGSVSEVWPVVGRRIGRSTAGVCCGEPGGEVVIRGE